MLRVRTHLAPGLLDREDFASDVVIVVDLIRASTTITSALHHGAARVIPCAEVEEARLRAGQLPREGVVLGGERHAVRIEGFDLGNGPFEYSRARVDGKTVVFTTTNGTRLIRRASGARRLLVGCLWNLNAVAAMGVRESRRLESEAIHVLCAGVEGAPCVDDSLAAGAIVASLSRLLGHRELDDQSMIAEALWERSSTSRERLLEILNASSGGRNLLQTGLGSHIAECARIDTTSMVPALREDGTITGERVDTVE